MPIIVNVISGHYMPKLLTDGHSGTCGVIILATIIYVETRF